MNPFSWLDDSVCRGLMLTLAHFLWQGLAVGVLAAFCGLLLRRRSAQSRYLLFTSALLLMAACPVGTYVLLDANSPPPNAVAETEQMPSPFEFPEQAPVDSREFVEIFPPGDITANEPDYSETAAVPVPVHIETVTEPAIVSAGGEATIDRPGVLRWLTCLYMAGVVLLLGRFGLGLYGADRLRRSSRLPDDSPLLSLISRQAGEIGLRKAPVVLICEQILVPAVVGILRPAVLVPASMITCLTPQELKDVLTHELAHVRRCDYLVNFVQRVVESFLFFHPAVWFVSRRIRIEREHCCDDLVLALGTAPVDYARTLLNVVENCAGKSDRKPIAQLATLAAVGNRTDRQSAAAAETQPDTKGNHHDQYGLHATSRRFAAVQRDVSSSGG